MANKSFKEIYESLDTTPPKTAWVRRIAKATHKSEITVRMWLCGRQIPDELCQSVIAKELSVPADSLFPN